MQIMFALTEKKSRIVQNPNALPLIISPMKSKIVFDDVVFGYFIFLIILYCLN